MSNQILTINDKERRPTAVVTFLRRPTEHDITAVIDELEDYLTLRNTRIVREIHTAKKSKTGHVAAKPFLRLLGAKI